MAPCYLKEIISNMAYKELITLLEEYSTINNSYSRVFTSFFF